MIDPNLSLSHDTERQFRAMADCAPVLMRMSGTDTLCTYFNKSWLDFTGRAIEEEWGNGWLQDLHPDDAQNFSDAYLTSFKARQEFKMEYRLRRYDRTYRWMFDHSVPLLASDGEFLGFVASCIDVTERRHLEDRSNFLLRLDDKLRDLLEPEDITQTAAQLLCEHLQANRCAYATVEDNHDTFNMIGNYSDGVASIVGRYTFTQFGAECLRLMRAGRPYVVFDTESDPTTQAVRDTYRALEIRAAICIPLFKDGRFAAAMTVHQARVREWRADEVELMRQVAGRCWESIERARVSRDQRNWFAVVESSNDAIITKTLGGIITSWNKSAERIFGYTADEAIGQPVTILFPQDHINEEPEIIRRIRNGEHVTHYDTLRRRKDGALIPISLTVSPVRNALGHIIGASKTARDITNQKTYETRLVSQANELEQFAYVASHDLQEPLRKLSVYTDLLVTKYRQAATADTDKYASYISDAVKRMQNLISELLNYSRVSRGTVLFEKINLESVIKDVLVDLEIPIRENKARVSFDSLPSVLASSFQMHQLFQNLISNAVKFRGADAPEVFISAQEQNGELVISVKDNGIGIEPKYKDQVFRVFQRLHSDKKYPGTGIGLAICKKIVDQHKGRLWLDSEPGRGSTFYVAIPRSVELEAVRA